MDCDGDGRCQNLATDNDNCGTCGVACPVGECQDGICTCPDGRPACFFDGDSAECCDADQECEINGAGEGFCNPI